MKFESVSVGLKDRTERANPLKGGLRSRLSVSWGRRGQVDRFGLFGLSVYSAP